MVVAEEMAPVSITPHRIRLDGKDTAVILVRGPRRELGPFVSAHEFAAPVLLMVTPEAPVRSEPDLVVPGVGPVEVKALKGKRISSTLPGSTATEMEKFLADRISSNRGVTLRELVEEFLPGEHDRRTYLQLIQRFRTARRRTERRERGKWTKGGAEFGTQVTWRFVRGN